jgi:hypothetical protein
MRWVAFSYSLPAKSGSSPRVALWRRLRRLGAVTPTGSVQVLPDRPECAEALQWLAQEMRQAGGEAVVMYVEGFVGLTDQQLVEMFRAGRAEEYAELETQVLELEQRILAAAREDELSEVPETLARLRRRHAEISRSDYFDAPEGARLAARLAQVAQKLAAGIAPALVEQVQPVALSAYQGRQWVTRPRPHVDRLACTWLIHRFIDPSAVVRYTGRPEPGEVTFDMAGADFGHLGNLCTFETMLRAFSLDEPGLDALAQIVHEIDLRDGLYARPETAGLDAVLGGWLAAGFSDGELAAQGTALFEGLYCALSRTCSAGQIAETTGPWQEARP